MQGKFLDGRFRHGVMQQLVQWSGEAARRLDMEHASEGFDRLSIRESLSTQSKVITLYSSKEVTPRKSSRSDVGSWVLRCQFD